MRSLVPLALLLLSFPALAAPPAGPGPTTKPASPPADNTMASAKVVSRGAAFALKTSVALDAIAADPDAYAGKTVKVTAKVGTVCRKKGCWLGLVGDKPAANARVTFKDYAFFAPLDCTGDQATVEGTVEVKQLGEGERAHLAKDGGKKVEDVPAKELRIIATALEVRRTGK